MLSHFYGREAGLELREDIDTVLDENMVVSMEPMIMIPEGNLGAPRLPSGIIIIGSIETTMFSSSTVSISSLSSNPASLP